MDLYSVADSQVASQPQMETVTNIIFIHKALPAYIYVQLVNRSAPLYCSK